VITPAVTRLDRAKNIDCEHTLEEIGAELGITRERVRQIEKTALLKLKRHRMAELLTMQAMCDELRRGRDAAGYGVVR
jgi:DNA-directed RNA polymerase sigma subunit (sigma70/sigma32)